MNGAYNDVSGSADWGPPAGYIAALQAQGQQNLQGIQDLGTFAGRVGAGVIGATQGSTTPNIYGNGTSPAVGGMKGFLQDFANAAPTGNGAGGSAFASMVNGGRNGGGAGGGMSVKQLQLQAKTADALRQQLAASTPKVDGQDPKVLGATDDEWDTMGAADKYAKVQGYLQGRVQNEMGARINDFASQAQERTAQAKAGRDVAPVLKAYAGDMPEGVDDTPANRLKMALQAIPTGADVSRVLPMALTSLEKFAQVGAQAQKGWNLPPSMTTPGPAGATGVPTSPNSIEWIKPPASKPAIMARSVPELDENKNPTGNMTMEVSGDPDAVQAWNDKQNTRQSAAKNAPVLMINTQGQQVKVAPDQMTKATKLGYKKAPGQ